MKTQIIKIIPCLLAGFILSACVGAVNLPAGTIAESKTETSESETQTPKKLVIKEPEPIAVVDKEPEQQIVIDRQPENPCIANPFKPTCGAGFASARAVIINRCIVGNTAQADPTCGQAVAGTNGCITDPFLSGCDENPFFTKHVKIAKDNRVIFCNYLYNAGDNHCTGSDSIADICTHDPFSRVCDDSYNGARGIIIARCIEGNNANDKSCNSAVMTNSCIKNPFGVGCNRDKDFMNHHATAGENRIAFCSDLTNLDSGLCSQTLYDCRLNPFGNDCYNNKYVFYGSVFSSLRNDDINRCIEEGNASGNSCNNAITANSCITNPFDKECDTNFRNHYLTARTNRIIFCNDSKNKMHDVCTNINNCYINPFGTGCGGDAFNTERAERVAFCAKQINRNTPSCTEAISRVTQISWLQSFTSEPLVRSNRGNNRFLTTAFLNYSGAPSRENELNLAMLGGDVTDAVSFHSNSVRYRYFGTFTYYYEYYYYGRIFAGTDLGMPIAETGGTVEWNGKFSATGSPYSSYYIAITDFILTINFGAGDDAGTIEASVSPYSIEGSFDNNGVITGTINKEQTMPGVMSGLIGTEGAVGVFFSGKAGDSDKASGYAGGFVARPPAE